MVNVPLIGGWKRKISRIDRMALIDCVPNPFALVLGAAVAFFHVFWVVHGPECVDSTYDRMQRPGRKHRRFKANGTATGPTIPAPPGQYGTTMISAADAAQKIGLAIGIVDGILDGIYYGASLMRRYSGCVNPTADYCQLSMDGFVPALLPAATFLVNTWQLEGAQGFVGGGTGIGLGFGAEDNLTITMSMHQGLNQFPPLADCTFTTHLVWLPSGDPVRQNWGGLGYTLAGNGTLVGQDVIKHASDAFIGVVCTKTEGVMFIDKGNFVAVGGRIMGNLNPIECHPGAHGD